jgi:hypothetical protein
VKGKLSSLGLFTVVTYLVLSSTVIGNNIVFLTSTTTQGNMGGLVGADARCQTRAAAASLPGDYRAWLSTSSSSASQRLIHSVSPYQLVDGTIIANNWADLTDGSLAATINRTESNTVINASVWTATNVNGVFANSSGLTACDNWTSSTASSSAATGRSDATNQTWSLSNFLSCSIPNRLYCIQQVPNPATISGRVLSSTGRPITHAKIVITEGQSPLTLYTNRYGNYSSGDLANGTYNVTPTHRRFTFTPASRNVALAGSNVTDADFTGIH